MFASDELDQLVSEMNSLWEYKEDCRRDLDHAWDSLSSLQNNNGSRIDHLKDEHDRLYQEMKDSFEQASNAFESGDHDNASYYSQQGHFAKERMPALVAERRNLINELQDARRDHQRIRDEYRSRKNGYEEAKQRFDDCLARIKSSPILVKTRKDGNTDNFFGGEGSPDGPGHGHIVLDSNGNLVYEREAEKYMPGTERWERVSRDDRQ